jgi:hypothetical protein
MLVYERRAIISDECVRYSNVSDHWWFGDSNNLAIWVNHAIFWQYSGNIVLRNILAIFSLALPLTLGIFNYVVKLRNLSFRNLRRNYLTKTKLICQNQNKAIKSPLDFPFCAKATHPDSIPTQLCLILLI